MRVSISSSRDFRYRPVGRNGKSPAQPHETGFTFHDLLNRKQLSPLSPQGALQDTHKNRGGYGSLGRAPLWPHLTCATWLYSDGDYNDIVLSWSSRFDELGV